MATLLGAGYRPEVLWQDTATPHPVAPAELPGAADVVVVGGGYCGLSAATELARRGRSVVVLDAHDLGWGASTRNGGMVLPELKAGPAHARARATASSASACTRRWRTPSTTSRRSSPTAHRLRLRADRPALPAALRAVGAATSTRSADELTSVGSPAHVVRGDDLAAEIGSTLFAAGLVVERSGGLHPARFHAGLVARAPTHAGAVAPPAHAGHRRRRGAATGGG